MPAFGVVGYTGHVFNN